MALDSGHSAQGSPTCGVHIFVESVASNPSLVRELIAEEVASGFIALVPGGLQELQQQYPKTAVGKLGLVLAEGRSPHLVVDSSISNVTANTILPNHMLLPRISDVMACAPHRHVRTRSSSTHT